MSGWPLEGPPPDRLGPLRLIRPLGEGGMGVVHLAFDETLGRRVAVKWLKRATPETIERLHREAHLHARVEHPAVCRLYQVGEHEGWPYLVLQFVDGETLDRAARGMELPVLLKLFATLADGVHAAHRQGLIHRDLKPTNLMAERQPDGSLHPYVMDFGLARDEASGTLTEAGMILGSPAYMAPEQVTGGWLDPRTDVYGLGAAFFEVLSGQPPFQGDTAAQVLLQVQSQEPPPLRRIAPGLPRDLETVLAACLSKDPARRYPSAASLRDDLLRILEGRPILARRLGPLERLQRWSRRNPAVAILSLAVGGLVLALGVTGLVLQERARTQAYWAQRFGQEVLRMDGALRFGRLLPPHDLTREWNSIQSRMEEIRRQMADASASRGPGHLALGEGFIILGDLEAARKELEAAWSSGFRAPETSRALGRCLAFQYQNAHAAAAAILDPTEREARLNAARHDLLEPAERHLAEARRALGALTLEDEANLALVQERFDEGARLARQVREREPWRYDALFLMAKALALRGREHYERGRQEAARGDLEAALSLVEEVMPSAPSDERFQNILQFVWQVGAPLRLRNLSPTEAQIRSLAAAEQGVALNGTRWDKLTTLALSLGQMGKRMDLAGKDPEPWFQRAERLALRVTEGAGWPVEARGRACDRLASLAFMRGARSVRLGCDPAPQVAQGLQWCERARREGAAAWETHQTRGFLEMVSADWAEHRREDPLPALLRAVSALQDCAALNPTPDSQANLAELQMRVAGLCLDRGQEAGPVLTAAQDALGRALQDAPEDPNALSHAGDLALLQARDAQRRGQDPTPFLRQGIAQVEKALAQAPEVAATWGSHCLLRQALASAQKARGEDPLPDARRALESGLRALALPHAENPKDIQAALRQCRQWLGRTSAPAATPRP